MSILLILLRITLLSILLILLRITLRNILLILLRVALLNILLILLRITLLSILLILLRVALLSILSVLLRVTLLNIRLTVRLIGIILRHTLRNRRTSYFSVCTVILTSCRTADNKCDNAEQTRNAKIKSIEKYYHACRQIARCKAVNRHTEPYRRQ